MDPPRHRKLRGLVSQAFTPRIVAGLEPRIAEVTTELLDATGGERLDLIESLAYPVPVIVIAELLGIPSTDRPIFRRWADTLFDQANIDPEDSLQKVGEEAVASVAGSRAGSLGSSSVSCTDVSEGVLTSVVLVNRQTSGCEKTSMVTIGSIRRAEAGVAATMLVAVLISSASASTVHAGGPRRVSPAFDQSPLHDRRSPNEL